MGKKAKKHFVIRSFTHKSGPFFFFISQFPGSFNTHLNKTSSLLISPCRSAGEPLARCVLSATVYNRVVREKIKVSQNQKLKDSSCVGSDRQSARSDITQRHAIIHLTLQGELSWKPDMEKSVKVSGWWRRVWYSPPTTTTTPQRWQVLRRASYNDFEHLPTGLKKRRRRRRRRRRRSAAGRSSSHFCVVNISILELDWSEIAYLKSQIERGGKKCLVFRFSSLFFWTVNAQQMEDVGPKTRCFIEEGEKMAVGGDEWLTG